MRVAQLRRYPVKSTGGEALNSVAVDARGLAGDRGWAVVDAEGRLASGKNTRRFRRHDAVFGLSSRLGTTDVPEVLMPRRGWLRVDHPVADELLSAHMGAPMCFRAEGAVSHMDAGQVSLVGTATLAAMADLAGVEHLDPRRFRVNLVLETDEPWVEESWLGRELRVGDVVLTPMRVIERCRMVDIAQDGVPVQRGLLKSIADTREMRLAVYADVAVPGTINVGDAVTV